MWSCVSIPLLVLYTCLFPLQFYPLGKRKRDSYAQVWGGLPDFRPVLTWDLQSGHKLIPSSCLSFEGTMEAGWEEPAGLSSGSVQFSSVQSLSHVRLFATPWIAARQASLSITNSWSSLRLTSIESVMPPSHLILCHPLLLLPPIPPSIRVFSNESTFAWGGQSTGVSALALGLPC